MRPASRVHFGESRVPADDRMATGRLVRAFGEDCYVIEDAQALPPFLVSVASDSDHWLFVSSNGGLTAGRRSPATALFPYVTEDKLADSAGVTGPVTVARRHARRPGARSGTRWPTATGSSTGSSRRLSKNVLGTRLVFEEENEELGLGFRASWRTSERFGFVRECTLSNRGDGSGDRPAARRPAQPAPRRRRRAAPAGLQRPARRLQAERADARLLAGRLHAGGAGGGPARAAGGPPRHHRLEPRPPRRRASTSPPRPTGPSPAGAALAGRRRWRAASAAPTSSRPGSSSAPATSGPGSWWPTWPAPRQDVARLLRASSRRPEALVAELQADVARGAARIEQLLAATDGAQLTADRTASAHHLSNVLFNDLRGGVFAHGTGIPGRDFEAFVRAANRPAWARHAAALAALPDAGAAGGPPGPRRGPRRPGPHAALGRVPAALLQPPPRRSQPALEPLRHPGARRARRPGARLPGQLARHLPELGGAGPELPRLRRAAGGQVRQRLDRRRPQPVPDRPGRHRLGGAGAGPPLVHHRLLGRPPARLPAAPPRALRRTTTRPRSPRWLERPLFTYADVPYRFRPYADIVADPRNTIRFDADRHARIQARAAAGRHRRAAAPRRGRRWSGSRWWRSCWSRRWPSSPTSSRAAASG